MRSHTDELAELKSPFDSEGPTEDRLEQVLPIRKPRLRVAAYHLRRQGACHLGSNIKWHSSVALLMENSAL